MGVDDEVKAKELEVLLKKLEVEAKKLEVKLKEIDLGSKLARMGMSSGAIGVGIAFVTILAAIGAALYAFLKTGNVLISGANIVWLATILVTGLVMYFAFIFRRDVKLAAQLSEGRLEAQTGTPAANGAGPSK